MRLIKIFTGSLLLLFITISSANAAGQIKIENAWSPEAPPVAKVLAGYMTITNLGDKDIKITAANSNLFKHVEIHATKMKNGMMSMIRQDNLTIPANGKVTLKPGDLHMMLIGKQKPVKAGSIIPLTLSFDNGETVSIELNVITESKPQMMKCGSKCGAKCGTNKCGSKCGSK